MESKYVLQLVSQLCIPNTVQEMYVYEWFNFVSSGKETITFLEIFMYEYSEV
jgi:hypothetical protein